MTKPVTADPGKSTGRQVEAGHTERGLNPMLMMILDQPRIYLDTLMEEDVDHFVPICSSTQDL